MIYKERILRKDGVLQVMYKSSTRLPTPPPHAEPPMVALHYLQLGAIQAKVRLYNSVNNSRADIVRTAIVINSGGTFWKQ